MTALGVDAQLRLVDRGEGEVLGKMPSWARSSRPPVTGMLSAVHRHVARALGDDPFLAGQQRDLLLALDRDDAVVDLAGQQRSGKPMTPDE
jgi:hypothetical protein